MVGYASPFSQLTIQNVRASGIWQLVEDGTLKYIRTGIRTRREGYVYAFVNLLNNYIRNAALFRFLNNRNVIAKSSLPFFSSVPIHHDTTNEMLERFLSYLHDDSAVVFCFHGVLKTDDKDYKKRFSWNVDDFEVFLCFLTDSRGVEILTTGLLVSKITGL